MGRRRIRGRELGHGPRRPAASTHALGLPVNLAALAGIYLGVQIVRQVPLSPGGIGVIETALVAGLTASGATAITATAAVLLYRLLSCWLLIPLGGAAAVVLRRPGRRLRTAPPSDRRCGRRTSSDRARAGRVTGLGDRGEAPAVGRLVERVAGGPQARAA